MDTKYPLVTIVTPCLNMESYIARTIDSVLSQDYPNLEYILVDGGSTDGTGGMIREYLAKNPERMRLIVEPDGGAAEALEKGLAAANGEVFAYINADDTYFPGALRTAVHWLESNPLMAGVYGNAYWIDDEDKRIDGYPTEPFQKETLGHSCYICQPTCFLRTGILRELGGFNTQYQVAFDYELWLRLAQRHELLKLRHCWPTPVCTGRTRRCGSARSGSKKPAAHCENITGTSRSAGRIATVPSCWINATSSLSRCGHPSASLLSA